MGTTRPRCNKVDCFQNQTGRYCELLTKHMDDPCPFYKTCADAENDRIEAHNRLVKLGREDLIQKYEFNPQRRGQW